MGQDEKHVFELAGGAPALDFVNTMGGIRGLRPNDHLRSYGDLVRFAQQAGLVDRAAAAKLLARAAQKPRQAAEALAEAIRLREALHGVLLAAAEGRPADPGDLATVDLWIAAALAERTLRPVAGRPFALTFRESDALLSPLRPIAASAADVLTTDALSRVHLCEESAVDRCGWLFVDDTKNQTRRFCDQGCHNRAKQRRHYERKKAAAR